MSPWAQKSKMAAHHKSSLYTANRRHIDPSWGLLSCEHTMGQEHKRLTTKRADLALKSSCKTHTYLSFWTYLSFYIVFTITMSGHLKCPCWQAYGLGQHGHLKRCPNIMIVNKSYFIFISPSLCLKLLFLCPITLSSTLLFFPKHSTVCSLSTIKKGEGSKG